MSKSLVYGVSRADKFRKNHKSIRNHLSNMTNQKFPSEDTGTMSFHNTSDDKDIVQYMGWDQVGPSKVYTNALEESEKLKRFKNKRERFYEGRITLGELMKEMNKL